MLFPKKQNIQNVKTKNNHNKGQEKKNGKFYFVVLNCKRGEGITNEKKDFIHLCTIVCVYL